MFAKPSFADLFRRNDDAFRNTMEAIFQKYSSLTDPGVDVCLKTMTCRTGRGSVPIDSADGERELEALKNRVNTDFSIREFEDQENDQMDVSAVTEDDFNSSGRKENSQNLWQGGESFQHSVNLNTTSHCSIFGELSPHKEEDEELEKTLSSQGSTLLDMYPSMLSQIGKVYRRQLVTDKARAVVQKYRRKHRQAVPTHHNTSFKIRHSCTLNKTTDIPFTNQSPKQRNINNRFKGSDKVQEWLKNKPRSSPFKSSSYDGSACFYSPRRNSMDVSGVTDQSPWIDLHLNRKPKQNPARVIDFSTTPYSGLPSFNDQSPDLDQTYNAGPTSHAVPASSVLSSPQRSRTAPSVIDQRGLSIFSRRSSLDMESFKDHQRSSVPNQCSLIGNLSPNCKSTYRPSIPYIERQLNSTASPKRKSPLHHQAHSELLRSPYDVKQIPLSSPRRPIHDHTDQCSPITEKPTRLMAFKRQRSISGPQSTHSFNGPQIEVEFRKLYHHFICRGTSSPCPSSHCHLCERRKETSQSPSFSSSSMSALALTPVKAKMKKRRRQPEVEESLRFKRFRESRSPLKHLQLTDRCVSPAVSERHEDKHTWDRGVLLQCPSPRFLRGTGNLRKIREANLSLQMNLHASSWRDATSGAHSVEAASPMRWFNQGTTPLSPSLSRRRLQYSLLQ